MSLRKKMAKGAMWSLIEKGVSQGISFVVFTIVARPIRSLEYGLVNMCYIFGTRDGRRLRHRGRHNQPDYP